VGLRDSQMMGCHYRINRRPALISKHIRRCIIKSTDELLQSEMFSQYIEAICIKYMCF